MSLFVENQLLYETVAQPHLEKFFAFSTFSMLPRKPHIAKDMKHSSRLENDKNASHFPSREVVQQSLYEKAGYEIGEVYANENNPGGRFSIWWEKKDSNYGVLVFYKIIEDEGVLKLVEEDVDRFQNIAYDQKPFKVVHRSLSLIDDGAWLVVHSNQEDVDTYLYH